MNRIAAIALSALCTAAAPAFANGEITIDPNPFVSTKSRAEVQEELREFRATGVNPWADDYNQLAHSTGSATREQVTAEYMATRDMVHAFTGEDSGSMFLTRTAAGKPVADSPQFARAE